MQRQLTALLILSLITAASFWFMQKTKPHNKSPAPPGHHPDYTMENFTYVTWDTFGKPRNRLSGKYMQHYMDDDTTELEKPIITIMKSGAPPWKIKSATGWISADGNEVLLQGPAEIWRNKTPKVHPVNVYTQDLRVLLDKNFAETDKHVEIISENNVVTADGMRTYFQGRSEIELLSNVHAHYIPAVK